MGVPGISSADSASLERGVDRPYGGRPSAPEVVPSGWRAYDGGMPTGETDSVVLTIPRALLPDLSRLATELNDRMHELLERNTDGTLSDAERLELEQLVHMAQFAQIVNMVATGQSHA